MSAQSGEKLSYNGEDYFMATEPLNPYFKARGDVRFHSPSSACVKGYRGIWKIENDKLYLEGLTAYTQKFGKVGLDFFFPGQEKVFADWYSGEIRIPCGQVLRNIEIGYDTIYEEDLFLKIDKGNLIESRTKDNRNGPLTSEWDDFFASFEAPTTSVPKPKKKTFWHKLQIIANATVHRILFK